MDGRTGAASRQTAETEVAVTVALDGEGETTVDTGVDVLDHLLDAFGTHGRFGLTVEADGDLETGPHHTAEDVGLVIGAALDDALDDRAGIERFADRRVPLDEAVASVVLDVSGRPYFAFDGEFSGDRVGDLPVKMGPHLLRSLATTAGLTLHAEVAGRDAHHEVEALFKATGRALDDATTIGEHGRVPSTKGDI
jgi:imidazoleglycerol-phosphate dehydratase